MTQVIVRAFEGEPLQRVVVSIGERLVYVASPELIPSVTAGNSEPVGFPKEDVFEFEREVFDTLRAAWAMGHRQPGSPELWGRLRRYKEVRN